VYANRSAEGKQVVQIKNSSVNYLIPNDS